MGARGIAAKDAAMTWLRKTWGGAGKEGNDGDKEIGAKNNVDEQVKMEAGRRSVVLLPPPRFSLLLCLPEGNIGAHCKRERGTAHYCRN